jgi:hypothetical protein
MMLNRRAFAAKIMPISGAAPPLSGPTPSAKGQWQIRCTKHHRSRTGLDIGSVFRV